jgi:hypothetical protein
VCVCLCVCVCVCEHSYAIFMHFLVQALAVLHVCICTTLQAEHTCRSVRTSSYSLSMGLFDLLQVKSHSMFCAPASAWHRCKHKYMEESARCHTHKCINAHKNITHTQANTHTLAIEHSGTCTGLQTHAGTHTTHICMRTHRLMHAHTLTHTHIQTHPHRRSTPLHRYPWSVPDNCC